MDRNRTRHEIRKQPRGVPPQVEWVVDGYFGLIDEIAAELERRRMIGNGKIWTI
jgi:hypothetical protein